jgi:hypothetical protein
MMNKMSFGSACSTVVEIGSALTTQNLPQALNLCKASWSESMGNNLASTVRHFFGPHVTRGGHYRMATVKEIARPRLEKEWHEETIAICGEYFSNGKLELRMFEISFLPYKWVGKRRGIKIRIGLCAIPHDDFQSVLGAGEQRWFVHSLVCVCNEKGAPRGDLFIDPNVT